MTYIIAEGNERNRFELLKQHGVWALHFKRRLKQPGTFDLLIHGKPAESSSKNLTEDDAYEKPLTLRIKIIVTE